MQRFFIALEKQFGNINSIVDKNLHVIDDKILRYDALKELVNHKAAAIVIREFYPKEKSAQLAKEMLQDNDSMMNWMVSHGKSGLIKSDVDAIGLPFNVAITSHREDEYFQRSLKQIRKWRGPSSMGPMDKLRLEIDDLWDDGCTLARRENARHQPYAAGIGRIMRPPVNFSPDRWTRGFAHVDELAIMKPNKGMYSANIYLQNPPSGGELHIWPITFANRWDFYRHVNTLAWLLSQDPDGQRILRSALPEPMTIRVGQGDLVLLCTQRPHAVKGPILGGDRVSIQCFIQYEAGKPFRLES